MKKYFFLFFPLVALADYNPKDYQTEEDEDVALARAIDESIKTHREERSKMNDEERAWDDRCGNNVDEQDDY